VNLLFLDTETSGLKPTNGQIIEIGAVIASLNTKTLKLEPVCQFESLVRLRSALDPKITRITQIQESELLCAPTLVEVQESWANWLESYQLTALIGHSIAFDISFLKAEGWYLPENLKVIDSLDLAKITFANFFAVNLESLVEKLGLEKKILSSYKDSQNQNLLKAHRALYDAKSASLLFETILTALDGYKLSQEFYSQIKKYFLPLEIHFLSNQSLFEKITHTPSQPADPKALSKHIVYQLDGQTKNLDLTTIIKQTKAFSHLTLLKTEALIKVNASKEIYLVFSQIYVLVYLKLQNPKANLKLHLHGYLQSLVAKLIVTELFVPESSWLEDRSVDKAGNIVGDIAGNTSRNIHGQASIVIIDKLEDLISRLGLMVDSSFNLTETVYLLEIYRSLISLQAGHNQEKGKHHTQIDTQILKISSALDFLNLSLSCFGENYGYGFSSDSCDPHDIQIRTKLESLLTLITGLEIHLEESMQINAEANKEVDKKTDLQKSTETSPKINLKTNPKTLANNSNFILCILAKKIKQKIDSLKQINLSLNYKYQLNIFNKNLFLKICKPYTTPPTLSSLLQQYLDKILAKEKPKSLEFKTFLNFNQAQSFMHLAQLDSLFDSQNIKINCQSLDKQKVYQEAYNLVDLNNFYEYILDKNQGKTALVMISKNSTLKQSQDILTKNFQTQEYLIFGESGSLTKIISKLKKGFTGLVVLKTNSYDYLQKMQCLDLFEQFWLADKPNIFVHPIWDYLSNQSGHRHRFLTELKNLYLNSLVNRIYLDSGQKPVFIRV